MQRLPFMCTQEYGNVDAFMCTYQTYSLHRESAVKRTDATAVDPSASSSSFPHTHTLTQAHQSVHCSSQYVLSHNFIKFGNAHTHTHAHPHTHTHAHTHPHTHTHTHYGTLTQNAVGVRAPPAAAQRYCSCRAGVKKRRAARLGDSVACV